MSMTREQVLIVVDRERDYQDQAYNGKEKTSSGQAREDRDLDVAPGMLMLDAYVTKAMLAWVDTKGTQLPALQQVAKVAAIAVRILERAGGSEELLTKGLR